MIRSAPLRRKGSIFERRARTKRTPEDILFSKYIRLRDPICRYRFRCLGARSVEASHIFGRGKGATRRDPDNVFGACWACHQFADTHETEKKDFARRTLGEGRYNRLLVRSYLTAKQAGVNPVADRVYFRAAIKRLERHSSGGEP
jgi:hypothetical protein